MVSISRSSSEALGPLADRADQLARDPHAGALLGAGELAGGPVKPDGAIQAAGRQLELGPEVMQVPAQPLLIL
jgi:hypothetical protein